jgi:hypothetical protein
MAESPLDPKQVMIPDDGKIPNLFRHKPTPVSKPNSSRQKPDSDDDNPFSKTSEEDLEKIVRIKEEEEKHNKEELVKTKKVVEELSKAEQKRDAEGNLLNPSVGEKKPDVLSTIPTSSETKKLRSDLDNFKNLSYDDKMLIRVQEEQQHRLKKQMSIKEIIELYHSRIAQKDLMVTIPPDMKYLLYNTVTEKRRALLFIWYFYVMHRNLYDEKNKKNGFEDGLGHKMQNEALSFFKRQEPKFKDLNFYKIMRKCKEDYEEADRYIKSNPITIDDKKGYKIYVPFTTVQTYIDVGINEDYPVSDGDEPIGEADRIIRFHFLAQYKDFIAKMDANLRREIVDEDDNEEFGFAARGKSGQQLKKISPDMQLKIDQLVAELQKASLANLPPDLELSEDQKQSFRLKAEMLLKEQEADRFGTHYSTLTVAQYKERAKQNTKLWRLNNPTLARDLSRKGNAKTKDKYHEDDKFRFNALRRKYLPLLKKGYIENPHPETLEKYHIQPQPGAPEKYGPAKDAIGPDASFPQARRRLGKTKNIKKSINAAPMEEGEEEEREV